MRILGAIILTLVGMFTMHAYAKENKALRVGIVGLTHSHVHWILGRENKNDIEVVGIVEPNQELAKRFADQYKLSMDIVYDNLSDMLEKTKPTAVAAFGSTYEHLAVVEAAAPKGIHVLVEKPLAVNMKHAQKMAELAKQYNIHLLTNYETTWYPTNHASKQLLDSGKIGPARKILVSGGHKGPKKLDINQEFLDWLLDPVKNGGGVIIDYGCYGANLITWLLDGERPISVTAVTQQLQPQDYPNIEDEATIILAYPTAQGIVQASWNKPILGKEMEVYGERGLIIAKDRNNVATRLAENLPLKEEKLPERKYPLEDPMSYFKAVIDGKITMSPYDLSSLENNLLVVEILDAARESAKTGKTVYLSKPENIATTAH